MSALPRRRLGTNGPEITTVGFGAWAAGGGGWSFGWGAQDDADSIAAIRHAVSLGVNWIDTAAVYGLGHSEEVVGKAIKGRRDRIFLATKFGHERKPDGTLVAIRGDRKYVHEACDASLKRLGIDVIDLYYQHRVATDVPLEETDFIAEGAAPSERKFDIEVPEGRLWVMGDNRGNSEDSRFHRQLPGGGSIPVSTVVGKVWAIVWPVGRWDHIETPDTFNQSGLAQN